MASLVLGAAGAVVGSFFGPLGTSIGWAVGSALGANLFQKGQSGPRLTDL
jgi:phage tail tape-measure protein